MKTITKAAPVATTPPAPDFDAEREKSAAAQRGAFDHASLMRVLFEAATEKLTDAELEWMLGASEKAQDLARHASALTEGLGCLIAEDEGVGSFQESTSLTHLLFHLSATFNQIDSLVDLHSSVRYTRHIRRGGAVGERS